MTTSGEGREPGEMPGPVDPDFASFFRDEPDPMPQVASTAIEDAVVEDAVVEDEFADAQAPGPAADTGRLFRSQGVDGHSEAVLALTSDHFGRLRTLDRDSAAPFEAEEAAIPAAAAAIVIDSTHPVAGPVDAPIDHPQVEAAEAARGWRSRLSRGNRGGDEQQEVGDVTGDRGRRAAHRGRGISAGAVYLIIIGATVIIGFLNAMLGGGKLGWPTGLALLASSVYAAFSVRRSDDTTAFITPPVAFLIATLTAGQIFVGSLEGSLLNRVVLVFFTLADNWIWIVGSTLAALVIVLVRRRRG